MLLWSKRRRISWAAYVVRNRRARRDNRVRLATTNVAGRPSTAYACPAGAQADGDLEEHRGDEGLLSEPQR